MKKQIALVFAVMALILGGAGSQTALAKKKPAGQDPIAIIKKLLKNKKKFKISPNTPITLDVVLKPRNENQISDEIYHVSTPGDPKFQQYYTPVTFRAKFGQPREVTNRFTTYFRKAHLSAHAYANGLIIRVTGKAKYLNKTFSTNLKTAKYHGKKLQFSSKKPKLPADLADKTLTVLGITNLQMAAQLPLKGVAKKRTRALKKYAPAKFTKRYHVNDLYARGLTGKGQTIGIVTFAGYNKKDVTHFWRTQKVPASASRISEKKLRYQPAILNKATAVERLETTLDLQQAGTVAPDAKLRVYQAPATDVGMLNSYVTAFNENRVGSISMSWGMSEYMLHYLNTHHLWTPVYAKVMNLVMAQGALQGISNFVASGDTGAYNQGVGVFSLPNFNTYGVFPTDSPWVTSTGGTTIPFKRKLPLTGQTISVKKERAWGGDYLFKVFAKRPKLAFLSLMSAMYSGGGGGISHIYPTPAYQEGVPGVNTFNARQYLSITLQPKFNPILVSGVDYGRNFPDISANADPLSGYQVYSKKGGWQVSGGTSFVAPQMNAVAALINSGRKARMGFWNPQLYALAQDPNKSPFTVLDANFDNSNLYYTGQPGKVYNQATGLGTVNFAKLAENYQ